MRDLESIRRLLPSDRGGRDYWQSLEELADDEAFRAAVEREFAPGTFDELDAPSRRRFLQLMGASFALAGLGSGCTRQPPEAIVPYVEQPEEIVPGRPLFFATALPLGGVGRGVLVESHEGRPTKVEGNPLHPSSLGGTDAIGQAEILSLYDPDRSQVITDEGRIRPWDAFVERMRAALEAQNVKDGAGLRILTRTVTSPTLVAQIRRVLERYPKARWHRYEPLVPDNARLGSRLAFGEEVDARYRLEDADVVLSLDADLLGGDPGAIRHARELAKRRRPGEGMSRLYAIESTPTLTGAKADHRLAALARDVPGIAKAIARRLGVEGLSEAGGADAATARWVDAVAADLERNRGRSLVVAGANQAPIVHVLAHAMNELLGNAGRTVEYTDTVEAEPVEHLASISELAQDIDADAVDLLVILGGNPVYDAPSDLELGRRLEAVPLRIHHGLYADETAGRCHWHVPEAHALESWSDVRAHDGTITILQPLIEPLYGGKTSHQVVDVILGGASRSAREIVIEEWEGRFGPTGFERAWRRALHDGVVEGTAFEPKPVRFQWAGEGTEADPKSSGVEIQFRADPTIHDGRYANNGWLQELPKPLTKLTWDNAAIVSPAFAARLGVANEDVVELRHQGRTVRAPVWIVPGQPDGAVTVHLGYGRVRAGKVGTGAGFDAYGLRTAAAPYFGSGLEVRKVEGSWPLAVTQIHHSMEGRHLVRSASLDHYEKHPDFAQHMTHTPKEEQTLYPSFPYEGSKWGMAIDLAACTGCSACIVACQAENNIAVVGKDQVRRGREMHWLRVDRYYKGDPAAPETVFQPIPCMQCENAPCEVVCPVGATVHSSEGLNDMVYNRCVGTRYCSNNCPYKVRRFNFYLYSDWNTQSLQLGRNPDVTVRSRGVMEKCTYCVQRINRVRIQAKLEDRSIRDGEVVTACQQACPADAISFGDLNDSDSRVAGAKGDPRNYGLLEELNTRPRTTYLALVRNPSRSLEESTVDEHHG